MKRVYFEAGEGRHFEGAVNYLTTLDGAIYAECPVPAGASDDYGYITLKKAILARLPGAELDFWYDWQEHLLEPDANADCDVYVEIG